MPFSNITVYLIGGELDNSRKALYGQMTDTLISRYKADKAFIGAGGVSLVHGLSSIDEKDAWVNFAENGFYKDYPEDTTFVANEVDLYKSLGIGLTKEDQADIAKDRQAMLDCLKNGNYTDITNDPL